MIPNELENDVIKIRVTFQNEIPETDIKNEDGVLSINNKNIDFYPSNNDKEMIRSYPLKDLKEVSVITKRSFFRSNELLKISFSKNKVLTTIFLKIKDYNPLYIKDVIEKRSKIAQNGLSLLVDTLVKGGQKIVREINEMLQTTSETIQSTSEGIAHALSTTANFIRESVKETSLLDTLESLESLEQTSKAFNRSKILTENDKTRIDRILKKSLDSDNLEAMILGLIAKGMLFASEKKFEDAKEVFEIVKQAAETENLSEFKSVIEKNIQDINEQEQLKEEVSDEKQQTFEEEALKYAEEALRIVEDWESNDISEEETNKKGKHDDDQN